MKPAEGDPASASSDDSAASLVVPTAGACRPAAAVERRVAPFSAFRRGIGFRLLTLIVLFSSAVTLISTVMQLYLDYRRDVGAIESRLDEIERSYLGSLAGSLWNVDADQLRIQLDGILRLPDMQALEVRETTAVDHPLIVAAGQRMGDRSVIAREFPLVYDDGGTQRQIGVLYAEATLIGVYRRLIDTTVVILTSQGIKTFLVSLFTLYIVHRLITRHLIGFAAFVGQYDLRAPTTLALARRRPRRPDELDRMVEAFNAMSDGLQAAYCELSDVNAALERDIAARRRAEEEVTRLNAQLELRVRQRTAELEAANLELGAFTYSVSHDLRAPLRRIEGFGQILVGEYGERFDERGIHYLERIRAGARDMAEMIDSFLKLSRSTRGELAIERIDLSALVWDIIERLREKDPERPVTFDVQANVLVDGDRRLLKVALQNLLDNAWKYTRQAEAATIAFGACEMEGRTVYFVRDNGTGFDMSYANRLFTPFSRLHRAEEFEGSGIGLATVQRIMGRHGGRIWADAEPGRGATFQFTFWEGRNIDEQP